MFATIAGVAVNAVAAWALIFGAPGIAPRGIAGAAWAQNIGVGVEMLVLIGFALVPQVRRTFNVSDFRLRLRELKTLLRVGLPSGAQVVADVLAWGAFMNIVMARFGTRGMAANNFVFRYMSVSFMPAIGIGVAVTALVGRYIGRGRPDLALRRADLGFAVSAVYMLMCGLLFFIARHALIGLFTRDPQVLRLGATLLVYAALYQLFDAMYIVYQGALRGAGDTFYPAIATAGLCWGITVAGGYLVARFAPGFGPSGPWIVALIYGIILGLFLFIRFHRGRWRSIHLDTAADSDTLTGFTVASSATH
jgi:MATE family multidrug resistance protein